MDQLAKQELKELKAEEEAKESALDAQKYIFQHTLMAGMGERMMKELKNPTPPSKRIGRAYRKALKQTIKDNKRENEKRKKGGF